MTARLQSRASGALALLALSGALAMGAACGKREGPDETTSQPNKKVGYDVRRLRPRNEETLEVMFDRVLEQAHADGKMAAVLFSADWCKPCQILDTELGNEHPEEVIGHVRVFELKEEDWEAVTRMDEVNGLRGRWHKTLNTYPVLVLLDGTGGKVEEMKEAISRLEAEGTDATLPNWFASLRQSHG